MQCHTIHPHNWTTHLTHATRPTHAPGSTPAHQVEEHHQPHGEIPHSTEDIPHDPSRRNACGHPEPPSQWHSSNATADQPRIHTYTAEETNELGDNKKCVATASVSYLAERTGGRLGTHALGITAMLGGWSQPYGQTGAPCPSKAGALAANPIVLAAQSDHCRPGDAGFNATRKGSPIAYTGSLPKLVDRTAQENRTRKMIPWNPKESNADRSRSRHRNRRAGGCTISPPEAPIRHRTHSHPMDPVQKPPHDPTCIHPHSSTAAAKPLSSTATDTPGYDSESDPVIEVALTQRVQGGNATEKPIRGLVRILNTCFVYINMSNLSLATPITYTHITSIGRMDLSCIAG